MPRRSDSVRTFLLTCMTLVELALAIYVVAAISPALGDLASTATPAGTTQSTTTTSVNAASTTIAGTATTAAGAATTLAGAATSSGVATTAPTAPTAPTTTQVGTTTTMAGAATTVAGSAATSSLPTTTSTSVASPPTPASPATAIRDVQVLWFKWHHPNAEGLDLILVIAMAAVGAALHGLTSLTTFVGNRTFVPSWTSWYVIRMPVGVGIAVILYFALRAGFVTIGSNSGSINPFGLGALGGLSGMFSKQATDKLREIFDTAFNTSGDSQRKDKPGGGMTIDHPSPASLPVGSADRTIRVFGAGFFAATIANVSGVLRPAVAHDPTQVAVTLTEEDVAAPGIVNMNLVAPGAAPAPSAAIAIRVRPDISRIVANDDADRTLHIQGVGFTPQSAVFVGERRPNVVAYQPPDHPVELVVVVTDLEHDNRGTLQISVHNPAAQGGASDPVPLSTVQNWAVP